ncbi:MAG: hypothetical protein FRX49_03288 [Trebouxia sp. A1-2]|nr:MAG: hypothetical protein FRX49_03288 [Trebouxia sp. A1-2]
MAGNPAQQRLQQDMHAYYKGDISTRKLVAGMLHRRDLHTLSAFARRQLKTRALPGASAKMTSFRKSRTWDRHADESRECWQGQERKGKERKGKERKGKERKGKERKGKERKGKERKGKERKGKKLEISRLQAVFMGIWKSMDSAMSTSSSNSWAEH